jgi:hypothetical protein
VTNQAKIHELRESEKQRLAIDHEAARNTLQIKPSGIAVAIDRGSRTVAVQMSLSALLILQDELAIAIRHAKLDNTQPETLRAIEIAGQVVPVGDFDE